MMNPDVSEIAACLGGAILAEASRPSQTWRGSAVSVALGICGGAYGPQGVEVYIERARRMHLLVTFLCGLLGAVIFRKLLEGASEWKGSDIWAAIGRGIDAFRRKPPTGGT